MKDDHYITHQELVTLWEEKNTKGLQDEQLIHLYGAGFDAIEKRCLATLSNVTINVVLDRILHEGIEKYPVLKGVILKSSGISLKAFNEKNKYFKTEELIEALSYLLVELLTVIGNITSDVLTSSLHKELINVTYESSQKELDVQSLHIVNSEKKRRGKG